MNGISLFSSLSLSNQPRPFCEHCGVSSGYSWIIQSLREEVNRDCVLIERGQIISIVCVKAARIHSTGASLPQLIDDTVYEHVVVFSVDR
jgi:hypothetical protein